MLPIQVGFQTKTHGPLGFAGIDQAGQISGVDAKIFYVAAGHASANDDNDGTDPLYPLATIGEAHTKAVNGRGDKIIISPGSYEENLVITKDYLTIAAAMPGGYARPDIAVDTGIALVNRSQGLVLIGLRFYSGDSDVVRVEGNGYKFYDCVFDGDPGQAATEGLMRLWCHVSDDSYTASEGLVQDCLFRQSNGKGLIFDCQHAAVGVYPTDNKFVGCEFYDNVGEDIFIAATAVAVNGLHRTRFERCLIGGGTSKNKATHVDLKTNKVGTPDTDFRQCFVNDDTIDTTALKVDGVGCSFIGCFNLDGVINGDAID